MTRTEIKNIVASIGLPYAYLQWHDDDPEKPSGPPFVCFYYDNADPFFADGINFGDVVDLVIEHYSDEVDFETDDRIGWILNENGLTFEPDREYLSDQRMWRSVFRAGVIIDDSQED